MPTFGPSSLADGKQQRTPLPRFFFGGRLRAADIRIPMQHSADELDEAPLGARFGRAHHLCVVRSVYGLASLLLCITGAAHAQMVCLTTPYPAQHPIQVLVTKNASQALKDAQVKIAELQSAPNADSAQLASLYALEAQSYSLLELDTDARAAASKGLSLAPQQNDLVHVNLLLTDAENVYDEAGLKSALTSIEAARVAQTPGSITDTCLLITLGLLQMRMNHPELAIVSLTQAYRTSNSPEMIDQKVMAAGTLASVMALLGDLEQALALNQELIDWATAHDATLSLSISKFLRGKIFMSTGNFEAARESFNEARKLSVQIEDLQGVAFADLNLREAQIARGQLEPARALCDSALRAFTGTKSTDVMKEHTHSSHALSWTKGTQIGR
jgi:tetratricopeptide (TPR) repeat protein